jgi:hypothetical protein
MNVMTRLIRNAALLALTAFAFAAHGSPAMAQHFVDGFLAQCTAVSAGTCTESTATGYARQQIQFQLPVNGVSVSANAYTFGPAGIGSIAGHAVYTALTGGTVVEVLPLAAATTFSGGALDHGESGALSVTYSALTSYHDAGFYGGTYASGATIGTDNAGGTVTAGQTLTIDRGILKPPT